MTARSWLVLHPRDTVLVRDGRSFDAPADQAALTVRPWPTTIGGAVRAAFGDDPRLVRGPALGRRIPSYDETGDPSDPGPGWELYFPVPADIVADAEADVPYAFRLSAEDSDAQTDLVSPDPEDWRWLVPPQGAGPVEGVPGWLPAGLLSRYLAGDLPPAAGIPVTDLMLEDPLRPETRVGLARQPDRRVRSGFLYQATHLRPEENWAFLAECAFPPKWDRVASGPVPLGGRGRLADVEAAPGVAWPDRPAEFEGGRLLAYLATPALWPEGWRIPVPPRARLVAAAVGEPEPVATTSPRLGWEQNRVLRWAVPAGSVYLLQFDSGAAAADWAARYHGCAYGRDETDPLLTVGFGVILTGVWA